MAGGIGPVKEFPPSISVDSADNSPRKVGRVVPSMFELASRKVSFVNMLTPDGNVPLRTLEPRLSTTSSESEPSVVGSEPPSDELRRSNIVSALKQPMAGGIDPANGTLLMPIPSTITPLQTSPGHTAPPAAQGSVEG